MSHAPPRARWLVANRFMGACLLGAVALEVGLLLWLPEPLFQEGRRVVLLGALLSVWSWWTLLWAAWLAGGLFTRVTEGRSRTGRLMLGTLGIVAWVALLLVYLMSWGLYFHTGRFGNLESLAFALENAKTSWFWRYLLQSERLQLLAAGPLVLAAVLLCPAFFRRLLGPSEPAVRPLPRFLVWGFATCFVLTAPVFAIRDNESLRHARRDMELDQLKNRLNPGVATAASLLDTLFDEPIEPCLAPGELRPRRVASAPVQPARRPSVLVVQIESLRHDVIGQVHQGREVTPHLNRLARHGLHLTRAYAQSTHSDYSDVCIFSSLYPLRKRRHHYYRPGDPWPRTLIHDVLKPLGYATAVVSSQNEAWGGMEHFLKTPGLDHFYDAQAPEAPRVRYEGDTGTEMAMRSGEIKNGKLDDGHTTEQAIEWITEQVREGRPFCLGMNLQSSHFPYELARGAPRPFQPCAIDFPASFLHYPIDKVPVVRNAYYNATAYCDHQIGRIVAALDRLGKLNDTILVVLGENGEAFHENGIVTHARQPMEPALRVACVFHAPDHLQPTRDDYPFELIDVAPTVLGLLGLRAPDNFQGRDHRAADRVPVEERLLFFHVENASVRADAVLLGGRWKLHLDRLSGATFLFDVIEDPGETRELSEQHPELAERLEKTLRTWRRQQLAYYHFPDYYQSFYPPLPPGWAAR